ncbi:MAG: YihY/virulence factor BrkB family protein [Chitinophagaceae bacterium]|nr:MAG: YihY/virulence factor BrkB family protein [Chitinophagaceae bacterium]
MEETKQLSSVGIFWNLLKKSFKRLQKNNPMRMAGATAFFTCFALPPIIVLLFQLFSIFFSRKLIGTELGEILGATLGDGGATQLRETAKSFRRLAHNWYMAVIGLVFLVFVATTLFKVIKNTLNDIWNIRLGKASFLYDLKLRGRSLVVIVAAGILFLASSIIDALKVVAGKYIEQIWQPGAVIFTGALSQIAGIVVVTLWFVVLFRYLANARPSWRVAFAGGLLTGILFTIGKAILSTVMINSNPGAVYGAGGAIALILLFVFYSSFILYFGASFIVEYSIHRHDPLIPSSRAYRYELQKIGEE